MTFMQLIGLAYFAPLMRLVFFFFHDDFFLLRSLNRWVGRLELYLGWLRDYAMIPVVLVILGKRIWSWVEFGFVWAWPEELLFLALSLYARWWRWHGLAVLQELARVHPRVHPSEFFEHLYARLGFLPHRLPQVPKRTIDPDHLDFRTGSKPNGLQPNGLQPKQSLFCLLHGVYDTFIFATLAYLAYRWKGARYIRTAGSGLSVVWASRLAQDARMEVIVARSPKKIEGGHGDKLIYALNHKSFFDFCLAPLAYRRETKEGHAAGFIPAIMVAKDHFKDNFFLYRVIGFGKMLEAWGMIFVDRKTKDPGKASRAVTATVQKLLTSQMSFSIYPQGTRARGQRDRDGSRWDAGYFCVGKKDRLQKEGGHFKKGVGYIAVETALSLSKHKFSGQVWIIPVALDGVGNACPKGSLRVQTETTVRIQLGDPIGVTQAELASFKELTYQGAKEHSDYQKKVLECCQNVDRALQQMLNVSKRLERRFFTDIRELIHPRYSDEVAVGMKQFRNEGTHVYAILDCIYALPQKRWPSLLIELANVLRTHDSIDALAALRTKIASLF